MSAELERDLLSVEWVTIPPGEFFMGASEEDKFASMLELPQRRVTLREPFYLSATPVTFDDWDAFVREGPGAWSPPDYGSGRGRRPVTSVSWEDVQGFLVWLTAKLDRPCRLPTEAEWEYACRAGTCSVFNTGDEITPAQANYWYAEDGRHIGPGRPLPVGSFPPNAFGLFDMHGTVAELVADAWHDGYEGLPTDGSAYRDDASDWVVCRGGAWDYAPRLLRSAYRDWIGKRDRQDNVGFRIACGEEA